jgi:hypothetical protein
MSFIGGGTFSVVGRDLTSAEILALDTVPVEILPAKAGVLYVPFYISAYKAAGTAYSAADMVLENTSGIQFATVPGVGFFNQSALAAYAQNFSGGRLTALGKNLQLRLTSAITTGNMPIRFKMIYIEEYPGLL